jgi:hypothetical protein
MKNEHEDVIEKDGRKYISTTINHPEWNKRRGEIGNYQADLILERTSEIGKELHKLMHILHQGEDWQLDFSKIDNQVGTMFNIIAKWYIENVEKVVVSEKQFFSKLYGYHGRPDAVYLLKGRAVPDLIDIKTGNDIKEEDYMQASAYKELLKEDGIQTKNRILLHCRRNGKFKPIILKPETHAIDFQDFQCAKRLYLRINKI